MRKAPRACRKPGCGNITKDSSGFCVAHKKQDDLKRWREDTREAAHLRGYDKAWERFRNWYITTVEPTCRHCREKYNRLEAAVLVHHIIPLSEGGEKLDPDNSMSLCRRCHDEIHGGAKKV